MIFGGDFIQPYKKNFDVFRNIEPELLNYPKIINFESTLEHLNQKVITKGIALQSSRYVLETLKYLNVVCVNLANNHVTDYLYDTDIFLNFFRNGNINYVGLGKNITDAGKPFIFEEQKMVILSFGWDVIRCKPATKRRSGVNPYHYKYVEQEVKKIISDYSDYKIVLVFHWNYELEVFPSPADRQFAHHLINIGVNAIIGHHSHIISAYEKYNDHPIFYGLGNFYFPQVRYNGYSIRFPDIVLKGISVEYSGLMDTMKIFLHEQDSFGEIFNINNVYSFEQFKEKFSHLNISDIDRTDYKNFYIKNRRKKGKYLPVYTDYRKTTQNKIYDYYVKIRQVPLDLLKTIKP